MIVSLDALSHCVIHLGMPDSPSVYHKAFEEARRELAELIATQERLEKKKVELRKTIEALGALCKADNVETEPSVEAAYILEHSTMPEEIKRILKSQYPAWLMPAQVKSELEKLGHDLSRYTNAQATIHMVLKRMAENEQDVQETVLPSDGRKAYRSPGLHHRLSEAYNSMNAAPDPHAKNELATTFQQRVDQRRKERTSVADLMKQPSPRGRLEPPEAPKKK